MFAVKSKQGYGVHDGERWRIPPKFSWIGFFHGGFAFAKLQSGAECLISIDGEPCELDSIAKSFCAPLSVEFIAPNEAIDVPGSLLVKSETGWTIATLDSQLEPRRLVKIPCETEVACYYGGDSLFVRYSRAMARQMAVIQPQRYLTFEGFDYVDPPMEGTEFLAAKRSGNSGRWGYCKTSRDNTVDGSYYLAQSFSNGLGMIQRESDSRFEFLDTSHKAVAELVFDWADVFRFGLAAAERNGVLGYYDNLGRCQLACNGTLGRFNRLGQAIVTDEGEAQLRRIIDRNGAVLIDELSSCTFFDSDFPCYHAVAKGNEIILTPSLQVIQREMS